MLYLVFGRGERKRRQRLKGDYNHKTIGPGQGGGRGRRAFNHLALWPKIYKRLASVFVAVVVI